MPAFQQAVSLFIVPEGDATSLFKVAHYKQQTLRTGSGKEGSGQCILGILQKTCRKANTHGGVPLNRIFIYFLHSEIPGTWNSICHTVDIQYIVV